MQQWNQQMGFKKTEGMYTKFGKSAFKNHKFSFEEVLKQAIYFINFYNTKRPKKSRGQFWSREKNL